MLGQEALAMAEELGLEELRAHALVTVGTAKHYLGDETGTEDLELALKIALAANSSIAANALNNLGVLAPRTTSAESGSSSRSASTSQSGWETETRCALPRATSRGPNGRVATGTRRSPERTLSLRCVKQDRLTTSSTMCARRARRSCSQEAQRMPRSPSTSEPATLVDWRGTRRRTCLPSVLPPMPTPYWGESRRHAHSPRSSSPRHKSSKTSRWR